MGNGGRPGPTATMESGGPSSAGWGPGVDTTQPPGSYVTPAPTTTVMESMTGQSMSSSSQVAYERLAPGGRGYMPTEYMPASHTLPPQQQYFMQYQPQPPYYEQHMPQHMPPHMVQHMPPHMAQPMQMSATMHPSMMPQHYGYVAQPLSATMPPGYYGGSTGGQSQPGSQQPQHMHNTGPPVHAAGEAKGKPPYYLPRPLAAPLGFPLVTAPFPTLAEASAEGDVITISATGASRWRLELKDANWERPIDAVIAC